MRPRLDEFEFLRETYEEMADTLHRANRLKRDAKAEKDRPKAVSAQHVFLNTVKELLQRFARSSRPGHNKRS